MDDRIKITLESLKANNFEAEFAESGDAAKNKVLDMIPEEASVGIGDSATLRQIGILDELKIRRVKVINPFSEETAAKIAEKLIDREQWRAMFKETLRCDVFLTGTNAVTLDGKLVNIDGSGNRVCGIIFGPEKAIVVVGKNKIVNDVDEAFYRIKNVIAPQHTKAKGINTPCTRIGKCIDCNSKQRPCNVSTIIEKNPFKSSITVIIVDEDLGLGWDESWPQERINKILSRYTKFTHVVHKDTSML